MPRPMPAPAYHLPQSMRSCAAAGPDASAASAANDSETTNRWTRCMVVFSPFAWIVLLRREHRAHQLAHRGLRRARGALVVAERRPALDARVLVGEGLPGRAVDDASAVGLLHAALA